MNLRTLAIAGVLFVLAGIAAWQLNKASAPTPAAPPAVTSSGPPTFAMFAGRQACIECHADAVELHATSGHSRTFHLTENFPPAQQLAGKSFKDPVRNITFEYESSPPEGLRVFIPGLFNNDAFPLPYVLGSDTHAATFLTLLPLPNGQTGSIEHRVSLFGEQLGLTPSHRQKQVREEVEMFGLSQDPVTTRACIGCHTTYFEIANHQLRNLIANVDCESCHGPGRAHVDNMQNDHPDMAITSLVASDRAESITQIRNCGRCHRLPENITPAELKPDNWKLVRFQPVGMLNSACFLKSTGAFACTTCHDPHESSRGHDIASQKACLQCHAPEKPQTTTCPVTRTDNCLDCHMPKVEIHSGIFFRDHWIRVHSKPPEITPEERQDAGHVQAESAP